MYLLTGILTGMIYHSLELKYFIFSCGFPWGQLTYQLLYRYKKNRSLCFFFRKRRQVPIWSTSAGKLSDRPAVCKRSCLVCLTLKLFILAVKPPQPLPKLGLPLNEQPGIQGRQSLRASLVFPEPGRRKPKLLLSPHSLSFPMRKVVMNTWNDLHI